MIHIKSKLSHCSLKKVAILCQLPESWGNVHSVWQALIDCPDISVTVIVLPFIHKDYEWERQRTEEYLDFLNVPYVGWDEINIREAGFSGVVFTSPYDETRPSEYSFKALKDVIPYTVYIPYGLEVGGGGLNIALQYCQPAAADSSAVFVRSDAARAMYEKYCPRGAEHVYVYGHPRMDGFFNFEDFSVDPGLLEEINGRTAVLWNAHFSFDEDLWSTFDIFAFDILEACAERPDIALIFRPHPLLWKKLINVGAFDRSGIELLKLELQRKGVILDERVDHRHAFKASAAMLSDVGTFLMEYLAVGKPCLYLVNPHGLGLNEEGKKVVENYRSAATAWEICEFLDEVSSGSCLFNIDEVAVKDFFHIFDGCAGNRIAHHVRAGLLNE